MTQTQNYNILCCDGGGIRGLLTAILLHDLPPSAIANTIVFAGTSTGGIISICLAAGSDTQQLVDLYSTNCGTIFSPALSPAATREQIHHHVRQFAGPLEADALVGLTERHDLPINLFAAKYNPSGLRTAISNALGAQVSTRVHELARKLFVATFQLDRSGAWTPTSVDNLMPASNDATLLDAALCTSAAPGYFPPHKHPELGYCADGGTFANNPSTFVLARALQAGVDPKSIRMLSIGTGAAVNAIPADYFDAVPPELWGLLQWIHPLQAPPSVGHTPLLELMAGSGSILSDEQAASILGTRYIRAQIPLTRPITLDSCAEVPAMTQLANDYLAGAEWANVKKWVAENFV
jgi:patatin-like phospholipase/acyl hydrolase